jgi:hypothetical protein
MRTLPDKTIDNTPELKAKSQAKIDRLTHKAALGFVLFIVLFFFFKMLLP